MPGFNATNPVRAVPGPLVSQMRPSTSPGRLDEPDGIHSEIGSGNEIEPQRRVTPDLLRAALDSLSMCVALIDSDGTIAAENAEWRKCANEGNLPLANCATRGNYLVACDTAATSKTVARHAAAGVREVLQGSRAAFEMEFADARKRKRRQFRMRALRNNDLNAPFAVLTFTDITDAKRTQSELRRLSAEIMNSQDSERKRIARELHDTTLQNLVAAKLLIDQMRTNGDTRLDDTTTALETAQRLIGQSMEELRTLSYLLHPPMLDALGLPSAIRYYARGFERRSGVSVMVEAPDEYTRLASDIEITLFRVVQEGLANIHRHSGSRDAHINLKAGPNLLTLEITDHGKGMRSPSPNGTNVEETQIGVGIAGMRLRLQQIGGKLEIESSNLGTTLRATVPH